LISSGVVLFDAKGERVRPTPLEIKEGDVTSVAFDTQGRIAAGYYVRGGGGVVLFDAKGERVRPTPLEVKEGRVTSVALDTQGRIAAGYNAGVGISGVVLFDAKGERVRPTPLEVEEGHVSSVAFDTQGRIAAGYSGVGGGVVLFDARGERVRPTPLEVKEGDVTSVAFDTQGRIAAGYSCVVGGVGGGIVLGGGVVLFDARGERVWPAPLEAKEGDVTSVAFDTQGRIAAGYNGSGGGGVALFDSDPISWRRKVERVANRNFTWQEWRRYFPGSPYRRTIRSRPWPIDLPAAERTRAEAVEKGSANGKDAS
jgi:isoaspartyl peptidase/L-asparaginase-like protein (Ntn-hydrolase superfamily)